MSNIEEYLVVSNYNNKDYKFKVQKSSFNGTTIHYHMLKVGGKNYCVELKWYENDDYKVELQ